MQEDNQKGRVPASTPENDAAAALDRIQAYLENPLDPAEIDFLPAGGLPGPVGRFNVVARKVIGRPWVCREGHVHSTHTIDEVYGTDAPPEDMIPRERAVNQLMDGIWRRPPPDALSLRSASDDNARTWYDGENNQIHRTASLKISFHTVASVLVEADPHAVVLQAGGVIITTMPVAGEEPFGMETGMEEGVPKELFPDGRLGTLLGILLRNGFPKGAEDDNDGEEPAPPPRTGRNRGPGGKPGG